MTLQCPFCHDLFKLSIAEYELEDVFSLFCPYCGLENERANFISDEVKQQLEIEIHNMVSTTINGFAEQLEKSFRRNRSVTFKKGKKLPMQESNNLFEKEDMDFVDLKCCERTAKVKMPLGELVYCPYCGAI